MSFLLVIWDVVALVLVLTNAVLIISKVRVGNDSERRLLREIREEELQVRLEELRRRHQMLVDENYQRVLEKGNNNG